MEFLDLTANADNVTLVSGQPVTSGGASYTPALGNAVRALDGNDTVVGSGAGDDVNGNKDNDSIAGAGGDDFLRGGQGNDVVQGNDGNDQVNGNIGNDTVDGGGGNDVVRGGQGDDLLTGGDGDDSLYGDLGADLLTGGSGSDTFILQVNKGIDTITDFRPNEDAFGIVSGEVDANNLNIIASGNDTLITDKISGQTIAVVQGVDSNTVANELSLGSSNTSRRLRVVATSSSTAGSFDRITLNPEKGWTDAPRVQGSTWSAGGFIDTTNQSLIFLYQSKQRFGSSERISLNIDDPFNLSGLRFGAPSYRYVLPDYTPVVREVVIPLVTTGNLLSTEIDFAALFEIGISGVLLS
jgi:RTX calcium-binding nonapeptide repeat (4 copies)